MRIECIPNEIKCQYGGGDNSHEYKGREKRFGSKYYAVSLGYKKWMIYKRYTLQIDFDTWLLKISPAVPIIPIIRSFSIVAILSIRIHESRFNPVWINSGWFWKIRTSPSQDFSGMRDEIKAITISLFVSSRTKAGRNFTQERSGQRGNGGESQEPDSRI